MEPGAFYPSLYKGFRNVRSLKYVTWTQLFQLITGGCLCDATERYRSFVAQGKTKEADAEKQAALCITPAVQCTPDKRADDHVAGYTYVSMVDFDDVPHLADAREVLRQDPHTFMLYTTLSGQGLRVFFKYTCDAPMTPDLYLRAFNQGNEFFARLTGLTFDKACKNVSRLSVLCHDADAYFNADSEPFHQVVPTSAIGENKSKPRGAGKKKSASSASEKSEAEKSKNTSKVDDEIVEKIRTALARQGITYTEGYRNNYIMRTGYLLNEYGIPKTEAVKWAKQEFASYDGDVPGIIRSCYNKTAKHGKRSGEVDKQSSRIRMATPEELAEYLNTQACFRHNIVSGKTEIMMQKKSATHSGARSTGKKKSLVACSSSLETDFTPLTDRHVSTLWRRFNVEGLRTTEEHLNSLIRSDFTPLYNPFEEYFGSLPPWDGVTDYIAQLARYVHVTTDDDHFTLCLRKWLVGMVAGFFSEKVTNQVVLVLIGPQGCGKTTFFEYMLPPQLYAYYCTKTNSSRLDKDDRLMLSEYALINFEELESMRPSEMNQLKAMITMRVINERRAYGHHVEQRKRIASFCGTGNTRHFLNDPTGTRRWLPFEVTHIDDPRTHPFPYEGIYSQALHLLRSGFRYWFTQEEVAVQAVHNEEFEVPNPEEELIATYFRRPLPGEQCKFVTTTNIQERINVTMKQPLSLVKIAAAMKKMGFEQVRKGRNRGFLVYEYTLEQIRINQSYINKKEGE